MQNVYAFFSETAANYSGSWIYRLSGKEVEVTATFDNLADADNYPWPDKVLVGLVGIHQYIRNGRQPTAIADEPCAIV